SLAPIRADRSQLEQVLLNLAVNARDAMPNGGVLRIETRNVRLPAGPYISIVVSDTGHGISPELLPRIFEPFFTTKEVGKGTGLGLSTVYGIVTQSGGTIDVKSRPGEGARFVIHLPAVEDQVPAAVSTDPATKPSGRETILLVEDEAVVRRLAHQVLERQGYRVLEAPSARDALDMAEREGQIDLLVTDVVMPELSGRQLAEQLRARRPNLRVLYISGYAEDAVVRGASADQVEFLPKPFTPANLARAVRVALDRRVPRRTPPA
ncbi:MAG: ATP-binding protein, partial [Gemmatimonadota bacterium]